MSTTRTTRRRTRREREDRAAAYLVDRRHPATIAADAARLTRPRLTLTRRQRERAARADRAAFAAWLTATGRRDGWRGHAARVTEDRTR